MSKISPNMKDKSSREFWESVRKIASEVESWPAWKRGGELVSQAGHENKAVRMNRTPSERSWKKEARSNKPFR